MHYCLVCNTHFKNNQSYNDHLSRKRHRTNIMKLRLLYSKDQENKSHIQKLTEINECDQKKS